ncbi:BMP family ABC transporter substrate-binding protein [Demequina capsici]|uniref:BMP family ABC transporter substrate-binding protein n=1 Tax=Demequina capsici TaxID=3075620 RepID=A0AA96JDL0_9MICO|nr:MULTISPECIES: BMP family ABC transporter substrate-binding protein [unclassified Demequina]WNM25301.1 BMP family ABC transporter substrate-binding protein [Demequina sp. OYTSA14]WNM28186.1 BMP family ABC transporter substrate-binding protein [Demequina sp. PMTSA13]
MTSKNRRLALGSAAIAAASALALTACSADTEASADATGSSSASAGAHVLKVAALTPGTTTDGGFNQSVLDALTTLQDEGLIEFEIRDEIADSATAEPIMTDYASQGYDLIIAHGIELGDAAFAVAQEFPDVMFTASGGADILDQYTDNVETWTYSTSDAGYLSGYIAGATGLSPVARVESMELDFVTATDTAFLKGLADANPAAQALDVIYTGSFDDAEAAASATSGLITQGAKLVYTTGDGIATGVGSAAAEAGVATVGVSEAAGDAAASVNVSTVNLDMTPIFRTWVDEVAAGDFGGRGVTSTIANGGLVPTDINAVDGADSDTATKVDTLIAGLKDGSITLDD